MDANWKNDPRLKAMDPEKLKLLEEFAGRVEHAEKGQILNAFMALNLEAGQRGLSFNDKETSLLVSVLTAGLPQTERRKLDTLKLLSKKLAGRR